MHHSLSVFYTCVCVEYTSLACVRFLMSGRGVSSSEIGGLWETISPLLYKLWMFYLKVILVIASAIMFVVTTILLYWLLYWLVVPKRLHSYPVFFDYAKDGPVCANVSLSGQQWVGLNRPIANWDRPTSGYEFDVSLVIEFPPSDDQEMTVFTTTVKPNLVTTRRSFKVHSISQMARLFRDFLTMAVSGLYVFKDSQTSRIVLIESFPVFENEDISQVEICMQPPALNLYGATLNFESKLSGLRYLLANHPILIGIGIVIAILCLTTLVLIAAAFTKYMHNQHATEEDDSIADDASEGNNTSELFGGGSSHSARSQNTGIRRRIFAD